MTIKNLSILLIFCLFIFSSCSSDDDAGSTETNNKNYFPLLVANNWDFENTLSAPNQDDVITTEKLSVSGTVYNNGTEAYELETDNPAGSGPVTLALSQGILFSENSRLLYTGVFGLGLEGFPETNFDVENMVIYDASLPNEAEMYSLSGNIEQEVQGFPITINYTLSTIMGDLFGSFEVNGETYDDVINSQLKINIEVTANITDPFPVTVTVLKSQDAIVITNYFADEVGLIQSETDTNFIFETLPLINLPLEDIEFDTLQILTDYSVSME